MHLVGQENPFIKYPTGADKNIKECSITVASSSITDTLLDGGGKVWVESTMSHTCYWAPKP